MGSEMCIRDISLTDDWLDDIALLGCLLLRNKVARLSTVLGILLVGVRLAIALQDRLQPLDEPTVNGLVVRHLNLPHRHLRWRYLLSLSLQFHLITF